MKFQAEVEADYEVVDVDPDQPSLEFQDLLYELRSAFPKGARIKVTLRYQDEKGVWNVWRG
jgi:hypothetical protein